MSELQFEGQRAGEKVKLVFRRSVLTARRGVLFGLIMAAVGILLLILFKGVESVMWVAVGCFVIGLIGMLYVFVLWYFSVYIVTNERIRQIMQKGLFRKSVIDVDFDKITSTSYHVGFLGSIFGYGTIVMGTDGGEIKFSMVSKPEKVYNNIENIMKKSRL